MAAGNLIWNMSDARETAICCFPGITHGSGKLAVNYGEIWIPQVHWVTDSKKNKKYKFHKKKHRKNDH